MTENLPEVVWREVDEQTWLDDTTSAWRKTRIVHEGANQYIYELGTVIHPLPKDRPFVADVEIPGEGRTERKVVWFAEPDQFRYGTSRRDCWFDADDIGEYITYVREVDVS